MVTLNWNDTEFLVNLVKEEFVRQHNKPKEHLEEKDLLALRKLAVVLHERRIEINIRSK